VFRGDDGDRGGAELASSKVCSVELLMHRFVISFRACHRNSAIKSDKSEDGTAPISNVKRVIGRKKNTIPDEILNNAALQYAIKSVSIFSVFVKHFD
jgi:hypothetical protein